MYLPCFKHQEYQNHYDRLGQHGKSFFRPRDVIGRFQNNCSRSQVGPRCCATGGAAAPPYRNGMFPAMVLFKML